MIVISFGDRKAFSNYYLCKEGMKLIKREDEFKIYRTLLTDGFVSRYDVYKSKNEDNLEIRFGKNIYRAKLEKSEKIYEQGYDDEEDGMGIILFPQTYYNVYVYKRKSA